ncbi:MAG: DUF819 domain-containing protein [Peptostreptococcaceae bacterium]|nr:DUF819 domain-containing protein [Peptostreptococcaceae bacterium]
MITNGFTYIAFLVFFASMLVAVKKATNWKIFKFIPPIVMVYLFNMAFCTFGLWDMGATASAYSATKNNLLYAMIFIMLLRCDFRKLAKLGGRMIAIFMGGAVSISIGFILAYILFKNTLGVESWRALAALCASWIGGSGNMAALQGALAVPEADFGAALIVDTIFYSVWIAILLVLIPFAPKWNKAMNADTSKLEAIAVATNAEIDKDTKILDFTSLLTLLGLSLIISAISQNLGGILAFGILGKGTMTVLIVTAIGLIVAMSPIGKMAGIEETANIYLYVVIALLASRAGLNEILDSPMWLMAGLFVMIVHVVIMALLAKLFKWDFTMVSTASVANIGGAASAPIIASAYDGSYAGIGVLMGVFGAAVGSVMGLIVANIMKLFS